MHGRAMAVLLMNSSSSPPLLHPQGQITVHPGLELWKGPESLPLFRYILFLWVDVLGWLTSQREDSHESLMLPVHKLQCHNQLGFSSSCSLRDLEVSLITDSEPGRFVVCEHQYATFTSTHFFGKVAGITVPLCILITTPEKAPFFIKAAGSVLIWAPPT